MKNYEEINHFVLTRFSNKAFDKRFEDKILDVKYLKKRLELFKSKCYYSLQNQSNLNFHHIILVHNLIPDEIYNELKKLNVHVVKSHEYQNGLNNYLYDNFDFEKCKYFITTRIDDDDMLYKNAINDIQKSFDKNVIIKFFGFKNGVTMDSKNKCMLFSSNYGGRGMIALGFSLIVNFKKLGYVDFNIHCGDHTRVRNKFLDKYNKDNILGLNDMYLKSTMFWECKENKFPSFIYYRHTESHSFKSNFVHFTKNEVPYKVVEEKFKL